MREDMATTEELYEAILNGDNKGSVSITREGLDAGVAPQALIDEAMIPAMAEIIASSINTCESTPASRHSRVITTAPLLSPLRIA